MSRLGESCDYIVARLSESISLSCTSRPGDVYEAGPVELGYFDWNS
jgi:hypothetical protein